MAFVDCHPDNRLNMQVQSMRRKSEIKLRVIVPTVVDADRVVENAPGLAIGVIIVVVVLLKTTTQIAHCSAQCGSVRQPTK